ncbi:MAG: hypothetical protein D3923_08770 [Candidatus Electrothrix sp. AR3]|nr:hypothetical protein [Candidatus Electrothrix sp. AR3]
MVFPLKGYNLKIIYITLILFLLVLRYNAVADNEAILPSFTETILAEQFPEYKELADVSRGLRRYRSQLESFREEVLEGYNRAVLNYGKRLIDIDRKLELDRKKDRISNGIYKKHHEYLRQEFFQSRGSGEYLKPYFFYLKKYKAEMRWSKRELAVETKNKFKF